MSKFFYLFSVLSFFMITQTFSQGCSDAGFCTMGAMRPSQVYTKKINFRLRELELNYYSGSTKLTPTINAATVDFNFGINDNMSMQVKLPYMWIDGNLGRTSGLGDISLSFTRNIYTTENYHINATLGGKIPTNRSDIKEGANTDHTTTGEEAVLPMYYQTSLGSYDIVAGGAFISRNWMFAAGVQIALNENENTFATDDWDEYPDPHYLNSHDLATNLKRGTDIMIRAERAFHFSKWDIRLGILPIWRITRDEIESASGERIKPDNTTGLALTALGNVAYHFSTTHSIKFLYGFKITDRDINPDGLTRDDVVSLAYVVRF